MQLVNHRTINSTQKLKQLFATLLKLIALVAQFSVYSKYLLPEITLKFDKRGQNSKHRLLYRPFIVNLSCRYIVLTSNTFYSQHTSNICLMSRYIINVPLNEPHLKAAYKTGMFYILHGQTVVRTPLLQELYNINTKFIIYHCIQRDPYFSFCIIIEQ